MRTLVTGADGFVGRHLSAALARSGRPLTLAVRKDNGQFDLSGDIQVVSVGDMGADTSWRPALADVSCVINLAGRAHMLEENVSDPRKAFMDINCHGAMGLFLAAKDAGVANFLQMSSVHVLGHQTSPGKMFSETSEANPANEYAFSKLAAEEALKEAARLHTGSLVIIRPPLIVGEGAKGNLAKLQKLSAKPLPIPLGGLDNRRTLLSVENLVGAIAAVLARWESVPHSGTYLLGDKETVSTSEIIAAIVEGQNGRAWLFKVPNSVLMFALRTIGGKKLVTQLVGNLEVDSSRFQQEFNWSPMVATKDSLKKMGAAVG